MGLPHAFWSGYAGVASENEAQRPVFGVVDADADGDAWIGFWGSVVADLERRCGIGEVEAVVGEPGEAEGLAETAGAGGKLARRRAGIEAAIESHLGLVGDGLQSAEKHAAGAAFNFAGNVGAKVAAVD